MLKNIPITVCALSKRYNNAGYSLQKSFILKFTGHILNIMFLALTIINDQGYKYAAVTRCRGCILSYQFFFFFYHFRNYLGDQVEYISQNLDNIQYQLASHPLMMDNNLLYDVFGYESGAPGQVRQNAGFYPFIPFFDMSQCHVPATFLCLYAV